MQIKLNSRWYEAEPGQTVLDVARQNGIDIPTLCHDPHLSIAGACRMCMVEMEGQGRLVAACTTPVSDGMQILTDSAKVIKARTTILDLLLADHPLDCLTCESGGKCALQNLAYRYGLKQSTYGSKTQSRFQIISDNPFIEVDQDKCILCGKCVRVDHEIQCSFAIDFIERGFESRVATPFEQGLDGETSACVFCGQCVEKCPTGALSYKPSKNQGRDYELQKVRTTCPYCGVGCQLELQVKNNKVVRVGSVYQEGSPNPAGESCVKGRFAYGFINHPDRLKTPLIKRDGQLVEATWDEALNYIAERLTEIKRNYGSNAIGGFSSAKCTNEENYLLQKFMRVVIGTNNVDHCARLCHASTVAGLAKAFGSGAMTNSIGEVLGSDVIFVIGSNPTENHPVIGSKIKRAVLKGAKLIVADPREIELSALADVVMRQRPGSDVALINAMMHVILQENLHDREFIAARTENFELVESVLAEFTPEKAQEITGVPAEEIRKAARLFAAGKNGAIYYAMGITQHKTGTDNVLSLANLAMLTGNLGREHTGVNPLRGQNNVQGACDMGCLPNVYPGYQSVTDPAIQEKFATAWGVDLSPAVGFTVTEMLAKAGQEIKALYVMGENPVLSDPDQNHVIHALESLELLVVQDIFRTETAELADVVLPAASYAEKIGTFTNTERRVQMVRKAIDSPGLARTDADILVELACRMGYSLHYASTAEIMAEIARLTPSYGGISFDRLNDAGLQWPCPDENHPGTPVLHKTQFTCGKGKFHPVSYIPPAEEPDNEYPFLLMTGRMLYHFHTGTMTRNSEAIDSYEPDAYIEINVEDAERLSIDPATRVKVVSRRGEIETWVRIGERVQPGQLFMPFHYAESPANRLTNPVFDPIANIPEFKVAAVRVMKQS